MRQSATENRIERELKKTIGRIEKRFGLSDNTQTELQIGCSHHYNLKSLDNWFSDKVSGSYDAPIIGENHIGKVFLNLNLQSKINDRLLLDDITNCILNRINIILISKKKIYSYWLAIEIKKMNIWEELEKDARIVEKATIEQTNEIVQLLYDAVGLFAQAFSVANAPDTSDVTIVKMSLLCHSFNTLKCSVDLALRGYYVQSLNLLRIVYENWIAFHYLSKCPDKAPLWLNHSLNKHPPGHAAMLKKLDADFNPLKGKMKEWYSTLCSFAHTNPLGLLHQISTDYSPNETSIHFGSTYKGDLFKTSAYTICLWAGVILSAISLWIPETNRWHNEMAKIEERIIQFIDQENEAYKSETT